MTTVLVLLVIGLSIISTALLILYFDTKSKITDSIDEYEEQLDLKVADLLDELNIKTQEILISIDKRIEQGKASVLQLTQAEAALPAPPVRNCAPSLSNRYPEVFKLAQSGLSLREISEQTGLSVDRVRLILNFGAMQQ